MRTNSAMYTHIAVSCALALFAVIANAQTPDAIVPPSLIFDLLSRNGDLETAARPKYPSPTAVVVSPDKKLLYVAEMGAKRVAIIDTATRAVIGTILMPNEPTGIAVSADGTRLYVTCSSERQPNGVVCVVQTTTGKIIQRIAVGHSARSPVLSPDGTTLYICNWLGDNISVVDIALGKEAARIPMVREPYTAAITPDGAWLLVTNSLPEEKATDTINTACKVAFVNTQTRTIAALVRMPVGSHSLFGLTISPDGKYAFASHLIGRFNLPALDITKGWIHSNNLTILDIAAKKMLNDVELDESVRGRANPWGVACTDDGKYICVLHAGSGDMTIIDLPQLLIKANGGVDLSHDFTSIQSIKRVVHLNAKGARALAIAGSKAYIAGYFGETLDIVDLASLLSTPNGSVTLAPAKPKTAMRQGESYFYDASICLQGWQSCSSCHPFTRPDALNWILNAANNTPKNVKSMLHTFQTAPTSWAGKRRNAFESVRAGIQAELFTTPDEQVATTLDTFLMNLKPVPSPRLDKGKLNSAAQRGKALYNSSKVDCIFCHAAPLFTDMKFYNATVPDPYDPNTSWDCPSLIEAWRTAPYGHLGSYDKIEEILRLPGHSNVNSLSAQEFGDLVEYMLSL